MFLLASSFTSGGLDVIASLPVLSLVGTVFLARAHVLCVQLICRAAGIFSLRALLVSFVGKSRIGGTISTLLFSLEILLRTSVSRF